MLCGARVVSKNTYIKNKILFPLLKRQVSTEKSEIHQNVMNSVCTAENNPC